MKIDPIYMELMTSSSLFRDQREHDNRITKCKFVGPTGKCKKKMGLCNGYKTKRVCRKRS